MKRLIKHSLLLSLVLLTTSSFAATDLKQALKLTETKPNKSESWQKLGDAYYELNDFENAAKAYTNCFTINYNDFRCWFYAGNSYYSLKNYPAAIAAHSYVASQGEHVKDYHYNTNYNLGLASQQIGNTISAIDYYNKSIQTYPEIVNAYINLGLAYSDLLEEELSFQTYKKGLAKDPNSLLLNNNLGHAYLNRKDYIKAKELFEKAVNLKPDYELGWRNLATTLRSMSLYSEGINALKKALKNLTPKDYDTYNLLGYMYHDLKQYNEAIKWYDTSIQKFPKQYYAYYNKGNAKYMLGNYTEAVAAYNQAIAFDPFRVEPYIQLAYAYHDLGQKQNGLKAYKKILELDPAKAEPLKSYYE